MGVFRPIVEATTNLLAIGVADLFHRRGIGVKPVGDDDPRSAIFFMMRLRNFSAAAWSPLRCDHRFQGFRHRRRPAAGDGLKRFRHQSKKFLRPGIIKSRQSLFPDRRGDPEQG